MSFLKLLGRDVVTEPGIVIASRQAISRYEAALKRGARLKLLVVGIEQPCRTPFGQHVIGSVDDEKARRVAVVAFCEKLIVVRMLVAYMGDSRQPYCDRGRQFLHVLSACLGSDRLDIGIRRGRQEQGERLGDGLPAFGRNLQGASLWRGGVESGKLSI